MYCYYKCYVALPRGAMGWTYCNMDQIKDLNGISGRNNLYRLTVDEHIFKQALTSKL